MARAVKQQQTFQIQVTTNPQLPVKITVDGQLILVPGTINLAAGVHTFCADTQVQQLLTIYGFDQWIAYGKAASYKNIASINITGPCTIIAQYMLAQSGITPAAPDSLPNPTGPMTPNLILRNPGPTEGLPTNPNAYREV